ncbi:unnamed protein product [Bursaphelenchus okinawaensis]|uniref:Uncharacterized protein n=1 Tax=Bursaphelenchus okinawaensis TaxID=465554 RepID=A0A811L2N4_9BILA|nr:unnamed protein product [Bursaphelenchus okinawaensis]CAG9115485.1 unnamed protein product [Bursaphelenchus okinawaensis]
MTSIEALLNVTDVADADNATTSTILSTTTTVLTTTTTVISTTLSTTAATITSTIPVPTEDSHSLFLFCTVLFFAGIAVVAKIIYSNRNKYSVLNIHPNWRMSASRTSGSVPFGATTDPFNPSNAPAGLGFGSAHYTAVTPTSGDQFAQAHEEWERQFFDERPSEQERTSSRLELRR